MVQKQKKNGKVATADLIGDAADAVLQGQQQVLGDLSQAILHWPDFDATPLCWLHKPPHCCLQDTVLNGLHNDMPS